MASRRGFGPLSTEDRNKLLACLRWSADHDLDDYGLTRFAEAFGDMLARGRELSDNQRSWVWLVHERIGGDPEYENLIGSSKAPRGREVPAPPVLQNLPKKPPRKRSPDD